MCVLVRAYAGVDADVDTANALPPIAHQMPGQISVIIGDKLNLIDDSNAYWWSVCNSKTAEKGYVPAEFVEVYSRVLCEFIRHMKSDTMRYHTTHWIVPL